MVRLLAVTAFMISAVVSQAEAAVRGGKFTGTINSPLGNSATATLDFSAIGNARGESQSIGGIANTYPGTYIEFELGAFSYWTGTFTGAPTYQASGFSFFSIISTYQLTNEGIAAGSGYLLKTGTSSVRTE